MSSKQDILFILGSTVVLIIPLWGMVRAVGALFSQRLRSRVAARPVIHAIWFLLSLSFFIWAYVWIAPRTGPSRSPTVYHQATGDFYWRMILQGTGREIVHENGLIFFYLPGHHGPSFHSIAEAEVIRTRNEALRNFTNKIAFTYDERLEEPLVRLELLTQHSAENIDSFCEWWRQARDQFEFAPDADARYEQYQWAKYKLDRRFSYFSEMEARERERISRGYYRIGA